MAQQDKTAGQAFGDLGELFDKAMSLFNSKPGAAPAETAQAPAQAEQANPTATTQMQLPGVQSIPDFIHGYLHGSGAIGGSASSDGSSFLQDMTGASKKKDDGASQSSAQGNSKTLGSAAADIMGLVKAIGSIAAIFG